MHDSDELHRASHWGSLIRKRLPPRTAVGLWSSTYVRVLGGGGSYQRVDRYLGGELRCNEEPRHRVPHREPSPSDTNLPLQMTPTPSRALPPLFRSKLDPPMMDPVSQPTERFNAGGRLRVDADYHPHFSSETNRIEPRPGLEFTMSRLAGAILHRKS